MQGQQRRALQIMGIVLIIGTIGIFATYLIYPGIFFRTECNYISPEKYFFDDVTITISDQNCHNKNNDRSTLYFKLKIESQNYPIRWSLSQVQFEDDNGALYISGFDSLAPTQSCGIITINNTKIARAQMYLLANQSSPMNKLQLVKPGIIYNESLCKDYFCNPPMKRSTYPAVQAAVEENIRDSCVHYDFVD